ncbi:MAG: serine/threonine protein phosphatase, partial [Eubacterium sp.]
PIRHPNNILFSVLNPQPGKILGTSLLRGLPFVSDILLKIYSTIGSNWERVGNLRYAVTYKPQGDGTDAAFAKERANQMASAWKDAMSSKDSVKDFVAVGDVKVSVIGADNQILDSEIPVRQMLEQIIAKTGLMPYMFGLSWSTTEKMSQQQADILTTELAAYRRIITPILKKIGMAYLTVNGIANDVEIVWDRITLQDETEHAQARYYNAMADNLIKEADDGSVSNPKMQDR